MTSSGASATLDVGPPASGWIVSPHYDLLFFSGSCLVPLAIWAAFEAGWLTGVAVFVIFQLAFNLPHNFQTWTLTVLDRGDRARNGRTYLTAAVAIALVLTLPLIFSPEGLFPWVRDAVVYWGYYHLVRQHYGLQRLYERRAALAGAPVSPLESKLYARFIDVVSYGPLLIRFRDRELMTIHAPGRDVWVRHPLLPEAAWKAVAAVWLLAILAAAVHHAVLLARGRRDLLPRALLLCSITLAFGLATLACGNVIVAIAIVTTFHNLQYLGLVWFHNTTRAGLGEAGDEPRGENAPVDWLRSGRRGLYAAGTYGYGLALLAPIAIFPAVPFAELPLTFAVALHYYVDSRAWRFQDRPHLARWLRLRR